MVAGLPHPRFASRWFLVRAGVIFLPFWQNPTCSRCCQGIPQRVGCEVVVPQRWIRRASHAPARPFVSSRVSCTRIARAVGPRMNVNTVAMMKSAPPATMVLIAPNAGTAHPVMRYPTIPAREKTTPMKL